MCRQRQARHQEDHVVFTQNISYVVGPFTKALFLFNFF